MSCAARLLALSVAAAACADAAGSRSSADFGAQSRPIVHGTPDTLAADRAVVAIDVEGYELCSGTLVAPRWVLTAGHCMVDDRTGRAMPARDFQVGFGDDMDGATWVGVASVHPHPELDVDEIVNDIGMLQLSGDAPAGVVPIAPLPAALAAAASVRSPVRFSGFGETSSGSIGTKLQAGDTIDLVCPGPDGCYFDAAGGEVSPRTICFDQKPGGPCGGDSGGPAIVSADGREYVAGVTSYGDERCVAWGCSTKVDSFEPFLLPLLGGGAGTACTRDGQCASGTCAGGVCCDRPCADACHTCSAPGSQGTCTARPDGTACSDADACTTGDRCTGGACVGSPVCPAPDACHRTGRCNPTTLQCAYTTLADGAPCDDGDACTGGEFCRGGECAPETTVRCVSQDPCAPVACDSAAGLCVRSVLADGTACVAADEAGTCRAGVCERSGCGCAAESPAPLFALAAGFLRRRRVCPRCR